MQQRHASTGAATNTQETEQASASKPPRTSRWRGARKQYDNRANEASFVNSNEMESTNKL